MEDSANAIVVVGKAEPRRYVVCVLLATTRLDVNGAVKRKLGVRRESFASADETRELTGMMIGGVTPLALPPDVLVWVDEAVMAREAVMLGGGSRSLKVRVSPDPGPPDAPGRGGAGAGPLQRRRVGVGCTH